MGLAAARWGVRSLRRHPLRTGLSLAGIAVAAAMLLDMVMLSGGLDRSFERLLLLRGFQVRVTPAGTLPFDSEATIADAGRIVQRLRADPDVAEAGAVLGTTLYARAADSLVTVVTYGIDPAAQGLYELLRGEDLAPGDSGGVVLAEPAALRLAADVGDSVRLVGRLDPQAAASSRERTLAVRGVARFLYDPRGQASISILLPVAQSLAALDGDRASLILVRAHDDAAVPALVERIRAGGGGVDAAGVAEMVGGFRERMLYFRQLSYILGTLSLIVTVLLIATLLTIGVNERLGEIATLRAIGIGRGTVMRQVLAEGAVLTLAGAVLGTALGLATARYLDGILGDFPGLPAAFSFFVPRADALAIAAGVLLVTGTVAGLYPAWLAARAPIAATLREEAM